MNLFRIIQQWVLRFTFVDGLVVSAQLNLAYIHIKITEMRIYIKKRISFSQYTGKAKIQ